MFSLYFNNLNIKSYIFCLLDYYDKVYYNIEFISNL